MGIKSLFRRRDKVERQNEEGISSQSAVSAEMVHANSASDEQNYQEVEVGAVNDSSREKSEAFQEDEGQPTKGLFARLKQGLTKTRTGLVGKMDQLFVFREIDEEVYEELEAILVQSDVGIETTLKLMSRLREEVRNRRLRQATELKPVLAELMEHILVANSGHVVPVAAQPTVIMVVGVNGAGKTTTIGKLAYRYKKQGKRVLLGAGDTFRAAAIEQLGVWAERVGVEMIKHQEGSDPAAVAFDAIQAGKARNCDVIIIDTAGRLQNKTNLMKELSKIYRVVEKGLGRPADEVLLVVDATTGQNALSQARHFGTAVPLTGVALTKLDSTAKGGIVVAIADQLGIPIKLIGIGEKYEDLRDFEPRDFVSALFDLQTSSTR